MKIRPLSAAVLAICLATGASAAPQMAVLPPVDGSAIDIAYTISFWSIPFGHTNFDTTFRDRVYQTQSRFETTGLVSAFWQSKIDAASNGYYGPAEIKPHVYDSYYRRSSEKKQRVKLTYDGAVPTLLADPPYKTTKYPVTDAQKKNALDPMSAIASVVTGVTADESNPCGKVAPVFDGRRRYNIEFTYLKDQPVKLDNGLYNGAAHLCQLHYRQIAGFKPKILKEGQNFPPIYGLFADVPAPGAPNGHYVVALRVWAKTSWGTVSAELSTLKLNAAKAKI